MSYQMNMSNIQEFINDAEKRKADITELFMSESQDGVKVTETERSGIVSKICADALNCDLISDEDVQAAKNDTDGMKAPEYTLDELNEYIKWVLIVASKK